MGVLSFSSVKNDLLIYWGMMGCWPLGQAGQTPRTRQRLAPSVSPHVCQLSGSRDAEGNISGVLGHFQLPRSPALIAFRHIFHLLLWVIGDRAPEAF